jgi:anti-sigma regulatory factor (Ser/Thr protein kinase)
MDSRKKVSVTFHFDKSEVVVSIRDSGQGFDPADMPDPTLPEHIHRPNGRGFLLMRAFVDRVKVESRKGRGATVHLFKQVGEAEKKKRTVSSAGAGGERA